MTSPKPKVVELDCHIVVPAIPNFDRPVVKQIQVKEMDVTPSPPPYEPTRPEGDL